MARVFTLVICFSILAGIQIAYAGVSEERFVQLEILVKDLERTVQNQNGVIHKLNERIISVERSLKRERFKCNRMDYLLKQKYRALYAGKNKNTELLSSMETKEVKNVADSFIGSSRGKRILIQNPPVQDHAIAFYAYMSDNDQHLGKHHTLIFDAVKTNAGNAYNSFSGLFIVPMDGMYVFTCSITMYNAYESFNVVKNTEIQGTIFVDSRNENEYRYASVTLVLALVKGDVVFVRTSDTYVPSRYYGSIISVIDGRSSFAGWRI